MKACGFQLMIGIIFLLGVFSCNSKPKDRLTDTPTSGSIGIAV
ncbi:hypothetical protein EZS27_027545, partial [termite gut metagenome]